MFCVTAAPPYITGKGGIYLRKTKHKTFSLRSRTTSLLLALLLTVSAASVGFAAIASAVSVDDDSGGFLAMTGAGGKVDVASNVPGQHQADSAKAFWVDAQYYDYLSDRELDSNYGWLNPVEAGTNNFDGAEDTWYPFKTFNEKISNYAKGSDVKMTYPLYFGNFCNTVTNNGSYISGSHAFTIDNETNDFGEKQRMTRITENHGGPYAQMIDGLYNYQYFIENSNGLNYLNASVMGLASNKLDSSGDITTPASNTAGSVKMPYFNSSWLGSSAQIVDSYFPFRQVTDGDVTTYSFDSNEAKDNVFFNWNGKNPTSVAYGQGKDDDDNVITAGRDSYGVHDGLKKFMGNDYTAGYGIFPFNRADNGNGGNNKLDYGFGIRMNMDFRVPANGKIGSKDVTFDYSGDDDLWVYITPYKDDGTLDYNNSFLALDLGGNHKKASGNINFNSMKSTITSQAAYANSNIKFKSDTMYIRASEAWTNAGKDVWVYAYGNGKGGKWIKNDPVTIDSVKYYPVSLSDLDGRKYFTCTGGQDDWTIRSTNKESDASPAYPLYSVVHNQLGNACWSDNPNWIEPKYPDNDNHNTVTNNVSTAGVQYATETQKTTVLNGGAQLDPDKTYHMTIFYMERGLIESNCQMSFTMTPVKNDFKVKKTIDTEHLNPGLVSDVTQAESFDFTTQEGTSVRKDTKYILNSNWKDVNSQSGVYALKSGEVADFPNQHETGSDLKVTETAPTGTIQYTTEWEVVDNSNSGAVIKLKDGTTNASGTGLETGTFVLTNPQNASAPANLQANFVNTPKVAPITVSKAVVDKDNNAITPNDSFTFKIQLNVGYGLKAYNLVDSNGNTATGGEFTLTAGQSITFNDIPVGATYTITETLPDGYKCKSYSVNGTQTTSTDGKMSVTTTVRENSNTVAVTNTPGEVTASFDVEKAIQSGTTTTPYKNGSLFSFTAEGLSAVEYADGKTSKDIHTMSKTVTSIDANGKANFANSGQSTDTFLKFDKPGVYILKVSENDVNFTDTTGKTYKSDITKSTQQFLVKITVTASTTNPGEMTTANEYYKYTGGNVTKANFAESNKVTVMQFVNPVKTGKITVNKKDGANAALQGVQFTLYKKNGDTLTAVGQPKTTNSSGVAVFDNLDIYVTGTEYTGEPAYQTYVLKETQTKSGHMQEATVYTFSFPTYDSGAQAYKYEYTFDYVNAALKHPQTGMFDNLNNTPLGIALIFLSFVSIGLYLAKLKRKQLLPINNKRFY